MNRLVRKDYLLPRARWAARAPRTALLVFLLPM
jgi:hypothetical protein